MASERVDIKGNWYGMMMHYPSRGVIHVTFSGDTGSFEGKWDFPGIARGAAKQGTFTATRSWHWLNLRIQTEPFTNVECRLTIFPAEDAENSMIAGVIPLEAAAVPFATLTLFRYPPKETEMVGICPFREFFPKERAE
jgi:hypothetical protein